MFEELGLELVDGEFESSLEDGLVAGGVGAARPGVGGGGLTGGECGLVVFGDFGGGGEV